MDDLPEMGLRVHFVNRNGTHVPATVVEVHPNGTLHLFVMDPANGTGTFEAQVVQTSDGLQPFSWHWPEFKA